MIQVDIETIATQPFFSQNITVFPNRNMCCTHCKKPNAQKKCKCGAPYCSVDCQKADWSKHKTVCPFASNNKKPKQPEQPNQETINLAKLLLSATFTESCGQTSSEQYLGFSVTTLPFLRAFDEEMLCLDEKQVLQKRQQIASFAAEAGTRVGYSNPKKFVIPPNLFVEKPELLYAHARKILGPDVAKDLDDKRQAAENNNK